MIEPDLDYWLGKYDWRQREKYLNARLPQWRTLVDPPSPHPPLRLHFVHKRSPLGSSHDAIPLLYCHSWPGGIVEVLRIIDALTVPSEDGDPAFHVVVPSVPGCGFSDAGNAEGLGPRTVAAMFDALMLRLGYRHYVAHGTGWGFSICRMLALHHGHRCLGIHTTTPLPCLRPPSWTHRPLHYLKYLTARLMPKGLVAARLGYHADDFRTGAKGRRRRLPPPPVASTHTCSGHLCSRSGLQAKPQTLAYALCDSPVGLLAWTRETLAERTRREDSFSTEDALDFTMISWLPGPEAPLRCLAATAANGEELRDLGERWIKTPLGLCVFPDSQSNFPPAWAACVQPLVSVTRHFGPDVGWPVWERPLEVAEDLKRSFGRAMLTRDPRLKESCYLDLDKVD